MRLHGLFLTRRGSDPQGHLLACQKLNAATVIVLREPGFGASSGLGIRISEGDMVVFQGCSSQLCSRARFVFCCVLLCSGHGFLLKCKGFSLL